MGLLFKSWIALYPSNKSLSLISIKWISIRETNNCSIHWKEIYTMGGLKMGVQNEFFFFDLE